MKRHRRIPVVIRLLNPGLSLRRHGQAPDIAGTLARDVEIAAVITELRHARLVKLHLGALGCLHLAVVESTLREPDPTARRPGELMRKQVRILHAKTAEDYLAFVGLAIAIGVAEKNNVRPMLHIDPVLVGENAQWNGQAVGENARLARIP